MTEKKEDEQIIKIDDNCSIDINVNGKVKLLGCKDHLFDDTTLGIIVDIIRKRQQNNEN